MLYAVILALLVLPHWSFADCEEQEIHCTEPAKTRKIDGSDIYRECWQYKYKLNCDRTSKNDCHRISAKDCTFVKEECLSQTNEGGLKFCSNYRYHYACTAQVEYEDEHLELLKDDAPADAIDLVCQMMCLDGECHAVKKAALEEDNDITQAIAMLNALKDAKKGLSHDVLINLFKGERKQCDKKLLDYLNCCNLSGGWGEGLGARCGPEALDLAKKRQEKKCVKVGSYCATEVPVIGCIIKRTTFCCYDSIISKIINQEAKKQLGMNNGTAKHPNCSGLQLADLERIDLSKADFAEFYQEIVVPNIKVQDVQVIRDDNIKNAEQIVKKVSPEKKHGFNPKVLQGVMQ